MESQGRLVDVTTSYESHKRRLTFEVDNVSDEEINRLYGLPMLNIKAVKYRKARSLTANGYFWKLINLITEQEQTSDQALHDKYITENRSYIYDDDGTYEWKTTKQKPNDYGIISERDRDGDPVYWIDSGMVVLVSKPDGSPLIDRKTGEQLKERIYWRIKGTHEMDSKEMSKVIDSVVMDAKALGIETLPPDELKRLVDSWKPKREGATNGN